MARRREASDLLSPPLRTLLRALLLASILVPLAYMLVLSVTPDVEIYGGVLLPSRLDLRNYSAMLHGTGLLAGLKNSLIICGLASTAGVLFGCVAGYVSARARFRGRGIFMTMLLAFQSVPTIVVLLPLVIVLAGVQGALGIPVIGTYWAVAVSYLTFSLPLVTWFVASYVESVPREIDDAARLDGAGALSAFGRVVLPLILPAVAVAGVLSFLVGWGDLLIATLVSGPSTHTVAVALDNSLATQQGAALPQYGPLMAASLVSALPVVVLYLALQRFLVAGLTGAAVK